MKVAAQALPAIVLLAFSSMTIASDAGFPVGWEAWPIDHSGTIPGKSTKIAGNLPSIVQETFKTYNWVNDGKGSAYNVRINPAQSKAAAANSGFADAPTAVLELTDIKVLLVTEHFLDDPQYGAYSFDGKNLSDAHPSLKPKVCVTCHSGYKEACVKGVCSK